MEHDVTKGILGILNNNHTKVQEKSDIKGNYYNYMTDTIYLTTNKEYNMQKRLDKTNLFCAKLLTICHECIHSVQNKKLHLLNLILSNLSIVVTAIAMILLIDFNKPIWYTIFGTIIIFLAILVRGILEIDAINRSLNLAKLAIVNLKINNISNVDINEARKTVRRKMPLQFIKMILDKIIMLIILVI